jgi:hypothetical protein
MALSPASGWRRTLGVIIACLIAVGTQQSPTWNHSILSGQSLHPYSDLPHQIRLGVENTSHDPGHRVNLDRNDSGKIWHPAPRLQASPLRTMVARSISPPLSITPHQPALYYSLRKAPARIFTAAIRTTHLPSHGNEPSESGKLNPFFTLTSGPGLLLTPVSDTPATSAIHSHYSQAGSVPDHPLLQWVWASPCFFRDVFMQLCATPEIRYAVSY